jgi:hypothetical protein
MDCGSMRPEATPVALHLHLAAVTTFEVDMKPQPPKLAKLWLFDTLRLPEWAKTESGGRILCKLQLICSYKRELPTGQAREFIPTLYLILGTDAV